MFVERDASGTLTLRRGFSLKRDQHVLVVEDVWTTGGSTQEAISVVQESGGRVIAAAGRSSFPWNRVRWLDSTSRAMNQKIVRCAVKGPLH